MHAVGEGVKQDAPRIVAAVVAGEGDDRAAFEMVAWRGAATVGRCWTRGDLAAAVRRAAASISARTRPGDRVVVAPPPGLDFFAMFLGCLGSGRIAVPAQTPTTARARDFLQRIVVTTDARLVLTEHEALAPHAREADLAIPTPDDIAYIQFTSGSTQAPRGAMITHGALAANLAAIGDAWRLGPRDHGVFWLPPFHDMGLVGALLAPVAFGFPATLMHPAAFLQRPARWLELISSRHATFSGAPNFAYDLCCDRIDADARARLDLSSWRVAVNGAEPISATTMRRFSTGFAGSGFRAEALSAGHGLAESVLFVTARRGDDACAPPRDGPMFYDPVSCGPPGLGVTLRIVDETRGVALPDGDTGAIWVAGPSLASGYWATVDDTPATFAARLPGDPRRYLRTGDLGFLRDGELYVRGRAKDVIVRAGRKAHAADIEAAIARRITSADARRTAVFACADGRTTERLVVVHEVRAGPDADAARIAITDALGADFELVADDIVLAPRGAVRITSSGKVARAATRDAYLAGALSPHPFRMP